MTDRAAIAGNYSDFKLVKSRSVAQIVIELPIEKAEAFLSLFGVPLPGAERPVALALLNVQKQPEPERPKKPWSHYTRAQQAGILCADPQFQAWVGASTEDGAAVYVREYCEVGSRTFLDRYPTAGNAWDDLASKYRQATGQMAEVRG